LSSSKLLDARPEDVRHLLESGELCVTVVGLGWMGQPTAALFAERGARVIGADVSQQVVDKVNRGEPTIDEPGLPQILKKATKAGALRATTSTEEAAAEADAIFIVVPTMIDRQHRANYAAVEDSSRSIGKGIRQGSLVVFSSTCGPGVTERVVRPNVEKHSGLKPGEGFYLAYSPIRAMGGRALEDMQNYNRVIGAHDGRSLAIASGILSSVVKGQLLKVHDIKTAEMSKLFETIYRDTNIALANELAKICEDENVDFQEVVKSANSQPYSHIHDAGPGVGGHCLPVYPHLLASELESPNTRLRLVLESRKLNDSMPNHIVKLVSEALRACGRTLKRSRVTLLGISYRPNVRETRYSPSLEIASLLKRRGAKLTVYDPKFTASEIEKMGYSSEPTLRKSVEKSDCVVISVAQDEFKSLEVIELAAHMSKMSAIVDSVHVFDPAEVEKAGLVYRGVGRGLWSK
jgi:nucleotide sugar dehydrogenase